MPLKNTVVLIIPMNEISWAVCIIKLPGEDDVVASGNRGGGRDVGDDVDQPRIWRRDFKARNPLFNSRDG